jgi:hypothetical protein
MDHFTKEFTAKFMSLLIPGVQNMLKTIGRRCRPYNKEGKSQDQPPNKNFENLVEDCQRKTLALMDIAFYPAFCEHLSDISHETEFMIIQNDAKGCSIMPSKAGTLDTDFTILSNGLKIHCGEAQTSLKHKHTAYQGGSKQRAEKIIEGLQSTSIDGKPVLTLISFLRWGWNIDRGYYPSSCGIVFLPHTDENLEPYGGKSKKEMRWIIKNPELYIIHSFAYESIPQIQDSVQSEEMRDQVVSQPAL